MMRSSVLKDDPGYVNFEYGKYEVFLNGKHLRFVITADEEEGFVLAHKPGPFGVPYLNDEGTETVKEILYGRVEIVPRGKL